MKVDPLPLDEEGNGARLRTLTFDSADAYMLARAMMLASNTAMMSQANDAQARLKYYRDQFLSLCPPEAKLFRQNTDVCEIAIAMSKESQWTIARERPEWRNWGGAPAVVRVGSGRWQTGEDVDDATFDAIIAMLDEMAPMNCVRQSPKTTGND